MKLMLIASYVGWTELVGGLRNLEELSEMSVHCKDWKLECLHSRKITACCLIRIQLNITQDFRYAFMSQISNFPSVLASYK